MENTEIPQENQELEQIIVKKLELSSNSIDFLTKTAKWASISVIFGYITIGFLVLGGLLFIAIDSLIPTIPKFPNPFPISFFSLLYFIMAVAYYFPVHFLHQFTSKLKQAIKETSNELLELSFKNLSSLYKYIAITLLASIAFYFIAIFIMSISFAMSSL